MLRTAAQDYEDIAEDIDLGAIEIRHPELLPHAIIADGLVPPENQWPRAPSLDNGWPRMTLVRYDHA